MSEPGDRYCILTAPTFEALGVLVNARIREGWACSGGVCVALVPPEPPAPEVPQAAEPEPAHGPRRHRRPTVVSHEAEPAPESPKSLYAQAMIIT
jgi:hypothetical protein